MFGDLVQALWRERDLRKRQSRLSESKGAQV